MLETTRALMAYGFLQIAVKSKKWLLQLQIIEPSGIPGSRITVWGKTLDSGLQELLTNTQKEYHELLTRLEREKKTMDLFIDDR